MNRAVQTRSRGRGNAAVGDKPGSPWPNEQTDKIDLGIFILGDHDFVTNSGSRRPERGRKKSGVQTSSIHLIQ